MRDGPRLLGIVTARLAAAVRVDSKSPWGADRFPIRGDQATEAAGRATCEGVLDCEPYRPLIASLVPRKKQHEHTG